ncbi:c-type cytochrome [Ramlibacter albus]|uniref:C-type cytochrome n=1 Tax=Ramlibacter albus TaxID=2079448 RepID=A0A923M3V5_9BURK|nr:c-type cytochrome [Ramlibacter albus]MBC5763692.1 c-type cytochrome [Ramlibacter albus]
MDKLNFARLALAFLLGLAAAPAVLAQAAAPGGAVPQMTEDKLQELRKDAGSFEKMYRTGRKVADFCSHCHGQSGQSTKTDVPNLAGQNTGYALAQLQKFTDGKRINSFCGPLMKKLSSDEKLAVAIYYTNQEVTSRPATDPAMASRGKAVYEKNCFKCHGTGGYGDEKYARIAGQQPEYLMTSIRRYKEGSAARSDEKMMKQTRSLTEDDMKALVMYIGSLK